MSILSASNSAQLALISAIFALECACVVIWHFAKRFVSFVLKFAMLALMNVTNMMTTYVKLVLNLAGNALMLAGRPHNQHVS